MFSRVLANSRYLILAAVIGSLLSAAALLVYGFAVVVRVIWDTIRDSELTSDSTKALAVDFIAVTDIFLLGTVLYIVALGLYELFIDPDLPGHDWLHIDSLDDLKEKLIGVVAVLLTVTFLGKVTAKPGDDILELGLAVAVVTLALSVLLVSGRFMKSKKGSGGNGGYDKTG